jgi:ubiquinone/menaquinone biosynthesis C-methylase UbiE
MNIDQKTVTGFGDEWTRFDQSSLTNVESTILFNKYFSIFPKSYLNTNTIGVDFGCGSGRWAKHVAPFVKNLYCIDPSEAIDVAQLNLKNNSNCIFLKTDIENISLDDNFFDFGYSLGVLHHIPDTYSALKACSNKLKKGAPFLLYLYYNFDNKPKWYKLLWNFSEFFRSFISKLPLNLRYYFSQIMTFIVYLPLARFAKILSIMGFKVDNFPLSAYKDASIYVMRTDSLDRFGTRLEQRFSKDQIMNMLLNAGFENIIFSNESPYWCAVGFKK